MKNNKVDIRSAEALLLQHLLALLVVLLLVLGLVTGLALWLIASLTLLVVGAYSVRHWVS
jgi:hypothetical protein